MAKSYNNIGNVYDSQGKYEEALEYYQKDLDITGECVVYWYSI
jgi:tetratricopeptide (TPR) repeat protein